MGKCLPVLYVNLSFGHPPELPKRTVLPCYIYFEESVSHKKSLDVIQLHRKIALFNIKTGFEAIKLIVLE